MQPADRLTWTIARYVAGMPRGTAFTGSHCATAGVRLAQELLACKLALCGRGGAYDPRGILALHARHWLFNQRPRAYVTLEGVFETLSEPNALLATPGQIDGSGKANLSGVGDYAQPKVAFGGMRGLPDASTIHFVVPNHTARQLVDRVDFVSTSASMRSEPALLFTGLCVMRWIRSNRMWRLEAVVAGVEVETVVRKTGFQFEQPDNVTVLEEPPTEALALLDRIDPLAVRHLEFITDHQQRLDAMERIFHREVALVREREE